MELPIVPFNLLIADDHQLIIDGLSRLLADKEFVAAIFPATDGKAALEIVRQKDISCALLDLNMPGISGLELTQIIKEEKSGIKIIIVTMVGEATVIAKLLRAGADAFIVKNSGEEEVLTAITKVMRGENYISQELNVDLFRLLARTQRRPEKIGLLTPREIEIIRFISEGMTNTDIAKRLFISSSTVDTHRKNIMAKLGVKNTASLIRYAAEQKLF